jgi:hypothetical protein
VFICLAEMLHPLYMLKPVCFDFFARFPRVPGQASAGGNSGSRPAATRILSRSTRY